MKCIFVFLIGLTVTIPSCRHTAQPYPLYELISRTGGMTGKEGEEALEILGKVLSLTKRVDEESWTNAYETRVLSAMSNIADDELLLEMFKFAANRFAAKNENPLPYPTKQLSVGNGNNWILMWNRGFHTVEIVGFYQSGFAAYTLELKCVQEEGKVDSGYTDITKLKFSNKNRSLRLVDVFTKRSGDNGFHDEEHLLNFLKFRHKLKGGISAVVN